MDFDKDDIVFQLFKKKIEEKGFVVGEVDEEGLVYISNEDMDYTISLENVRKDYAQHDNSEEIVQNFVDAIAANDDLPAWEEAKNQVYPSLFPAEFEYGDYINFPVTGTFNMIIVYEDPSRKVWINEQQLEEWKIDNQTAVQVAYGNIDKVLEQAILEVEEVDGKKLCHFTLEDDTMKAALLVAKGLKKKISKEIGWPVCAVMPVRNFIYLFAADEFDFFAERLGDIVMEEYQQSGYPITTEILEFSDEGIRAIANYEIRDNENEEE